MIDYCPAVHLISKKIIYCKKKKNMYIKLLYLTFVTSAMMAMPLVWQNISLYIIILKFFKIFIG